MTKIPLSRRDMMIQCGIAGFAALCKDADGIESTKAAPNVRVITRGPKHHWFGYYDKFEFDPNDRFVLGMEVNFEHRSPRANDEIKVGMVDLKDDDRWIELGATTAWCWQQGCMLQWLPSSKSEVIWNDRQDGQYISRILDVNTSNQRSVPHAIYALSPDGKTGLSPDFRRLNDMRPGYGYVGFPDPFAEDPAPKDTGVFRVDLLSGNVELIISLAEITQLGTIPQKKPGIKHYVNHLLFNPEGSRFVFLHRWRYHDGRRLSRMLTANPDGSELRVLDDNGLTSHFFWRDNKHILAWSEQPTHGKALYLFEDGSKSVKVVGEDVIAADGHCSYLPGSKWILDDTYPDSERFQEVFLYNPSMQRRISLGRFLSPAPYTGEWRCDTHPRISRNGRMIVIDSPHQDEGRQLHLINLDGVIS